MRRRTLLVALAALAVVVAAGVVVLWPRANRVTRENFDRLRLGMTRGEVVAVLGPAGDYAATDTKPDLPSESGQVLAAPLQPMPVSTTSVYYYPMAPLKRWIGDRSEIDIEFDEAGTVKSALYMPVRTIDHGPIGNLLWRLKRQWHRWFP
jgi:hypothetical protein